MTLYQFALWCLDAGALFKPVILYHLDNQGEMGNEKQQTIKQTRKFLWRMVES
jgi:hypothetical protein